MFCTRTLAGQDPISPPQVVLWRICRSLEESSSVEAQPLGKAIKIPQSIWRAQDLTDRKFTLLVVSM